MVSKMCLTWNQPKWVWYAVPVLTLSVCSTIFTTLSAFNRICVKVIPGAWFIAYIRLAISIPQVKSALVTDWSHSITVGYQKCYSIANLSHSYALEGSQIVPQLTFGYGSIITTCYPVLYLVKNPDPGTYIYNTWGTVTYIVCSGV